MSKFYRSALGAVGLAAMSFAVSGAAVAMDGYYKDKTLKIVIPYGPGGTYDNYSQAFSKHIGKHIPDKPTVIIQHMPGAGGSKAMNWAYNVMAKDGLNMLTPLDNTILNQLLRPEKMRYDARNYTWLGSSNQTNMVLVVRSDTGVNTWKDLQKRKSIGAAVGTGSFGYIIQRLTSGLMKFDLKTVTGYKGSAGTTHAVGQGEAEMKANNWLTYASRVPQWFTGDKPFARAVVQVGVFKDPALPKSVPLISELVTDPLDRKVVDFIGVAGLLGRGLVLPPKVPAHTIKTLRAAYDAMNADPAFEAELKKRKLRLIPSKGADIQKTVEEAMTATTPEVVAFVRKAIFGN